ncbi:PA14 domain-containing protein [Cohnella soli]|uniref:PA14 domain-containing protein n=1 Tax=Cohnella soli TaxID=425005 RepID=A0ABW0HQM9_9BACL
MRNAKRSLFILLCIISLFVTPFSSGISNATSPTGTGLTGEYFNNPDLTDLALTRVDPTIDFTWGAGSPDPAIDPAYFSVRWTGKIQPQYSEAYVFNMDQSDGAKIWVNGQLILDSWEDEMPKTSSPIVLIAGTLYDIKVEFVVYGTGATAILKWSSPSQTQQVVPQSQLYVNVPEPPIGTGTGTGLMGAYFNSEYLTDLALTRIDPTINFTWGTGSPDPTMDPDYFSIRWTGKIQPQYSEAYVFSMEQSDGARIWVNGQLILDGWEYEMPKTSSPIELTAGMLYDIKVEFAVYGTGATAILKWSSQSQAQQVVPQSQLYVNVPEVPAGTGTGLTGVYYNSHELTNLALTRIDPTINFTWGTGSPDPTMDPDYFSVRWTGKIQPQYSEAYVFSMEQSDGARIWVNGQLILDGWEYEKPKTSSPIELTAGMLYDIKVEFAVYGTGATAILKWSSQSQAQQVVPQSQLYVVNTVLSKPTGVKVSGLTSSTATVSWSAQPNDVGIESYEVYVNAALAAATPPSTTPSVTLNNLSPNHLYRITVKAKGINGQYSDSSSRIITYLPGSTLKYNYTKGRLMSITLQSTNELVRSFLYDLKGRLVGTIMG